MKPYYQDDLVTLYHGDALEVWPEIESASVVILDPPYSFETLSVRGRDDGAAGTSATPIRLFTESLQQANRCLVDGGILVTLTAWRRFPDIAYMTTREGFRLTSCVAWTRGRVGTGGIFRSSWDPILVASKGSPRLRDKSAVPNVVDVDPISGSEHPYEKPPALWAHFVKRVPCGVVLDPYAGTSASAVAAVSHGHKWIGIEVNEEFCELSARRLSQSSLAGIFTAVNE